MLRLFVAFDVPEAQKDSVEEAIAPLAVPGARWTSRQSWHVTLKFLGATPEERLSEVTGVVEQAASASQPARTSLRDLGAFPSFRRARVLWVGLDDPGAVLAALALYAVALSGCAIHPLPERRHADSQRVKLFRAPPGAQASGDALAPGEDGQLSKLPQQQGRVNPGCIDDGGLHRQVIGHSHHGGHRCHRLAGVRNALGSRPIILGNEDVIGEADTSRPCVLQRMHHVPQLCRGGGSCEPTQLHVNPHDQLPFGRTMGGSHTGSRWQTSSWRESGRPVLDAGTRVVAWSA